MQPIITIEPHHRLKSRAGAKAEAGVAATKESVIRKCTGLLPGLALMALSANAIASCYGTAASDLDLGTLTFDGSLPVGSILKDVTIRDSNRRGYVYCNAGRYVRATRGGTHIVRAPDVYSSNIPGIGYRVFFNGSGWTPTQGSLFPWPDSYMEYATQPPKIFGIQLIKTGPIAEGGVLSGVAAVNYVSGSSPYMTYHWGRAVLEPAVPTCTFTVNGGRDVDLGRHPANLFTGINSTSPPVTFNITSGGCSADTTRVHMAWRGTVDPNNAAAFKITSGPLQGVGIWIQRASNNANVVPNGAVHSFNPLPNGEHYEYKARFTQTAATVTEGTGSTAVTINITYN